MFKKVILFTLLLVSIKSVQAQNPELIVASDDGSDFGEIIILDNSLYRSGLAHEITITDLSDPNFPTTLIATGSSTNDQASLRMTISPNGDQVFLSEFASNIRKATVVDGTVATLENVGTFDAEVLGLDFYNNLLYFTTTAPQIISVSCDNPDASLTVFFELDEIFPIFNTTIQGDNLYYATQSSFNDPIDYQIFRLDLTQTNPQPELITTTQERGWSLTTIGNFLYIASDQNNTIYRKDLTDPSTTETPPFITLDIPSGNLFSIAHDGDFLYYSQNDASGGQIFRLEDEVLSTDTFTTTSIKLYPNPAQDFINIQTPLFSQQQSQNYQVYDMLGHLITKGTLPNNEVTISTQKFPKGVYFIKIQEQTLRFIKK